MTKIDAQYSKLFKPLKVGTSQLQHRVVMAPLTRVRAHSDHTPSQLANEYYTQRASVPGTMLITEATFITERAGGIPNAPGIWAPQHINAWKSIADSVHSHDSFLWMQLWALGRAAEPRVLESEPTGPHDYVSASNIGLNGKRGAPRPLTKEEIQSYIEDYATAAENAIVKAGLDGVEIHGANGYLIDQFLQSVSNTRTDEYGGSIENRIRFAMKVLQAVTDRVGQERVGIRMSPFGKFQNMGEMDPYPLFEYYVRQIRDTFPRLAYIHVIEPRVVDPTVTLPEDEIVDSVAPFRAIWQSQTSQADGEQDRRPFLTAGGFTLEQAVKAADEDHSVVVFGRHFISNPDLPLRLKYGIALESYDRNTFYTPGPKGYTTYPFSNAVNRL